MLQTELKMAVLESLFGQVLEFEKLDVTPHLDVLRDLEVHDWFEVGWAEEGEGESLDFDGDLASRGGFSKGKGQMHEVV